MFYYIKEPCTPSFPTGLVKTESDFIVRSIQTALGRSILKVAVISVDAYPFLASSDPTCQLEDTGMVVFWLHCAADSKETKLGSSNQEASPSAGKDTRVVLVQCHIWKCVPTAFSSGVNISKVPECRLCSVRVRKLVQRLVTHELTAYLYVFDLFSTQ